VDLQADDGREVSLLDGLRGHYPRFGMAGLKTNDHGPLRETSMEPEALTRPISRDRTKLPSGIYAYIGDSAADIREQEL
jgi:hypothetical protein